MNTFQKISVAAAVAVVCALVYAAVFFDPRFQPLGSTAAYVLSSPGIADGNTKLFRPYFDDVNWWGDLEAYAVSANGAIAASPTWTANDLLDARGYATRRIFSRREDNKVELMFTSLGAMSAAQQTALGSQAMMNFIRGDRSNEGAVYRKRLTVMGDIINSTPVYVEYHPTDLTKNRIYVGANDGMLHAFNAGTGAEEWAYIPTEVIPDLHNLSDLTYSDGHRYYVNGEITSREIVLADGTKARPLVSGLGAGGQAYFHIDVVDTDIDTDAKLMAKHKWEINDRNPGMADLGFTYSRALIVKVKNGTGWRWALIFGNGYGSTVDDGMVGSGRAVLFVVDLYSGALVRKIDTLAGDLANPNGLSSPSVEDLNADGIADYAYAGDLDGNIWKFDLTDSNPASWHVDFSGLPMFRTVNGQGQVQAITTPPRVVRHPDGGLLVMVATGRMLSATDEDFTVDEVQSVYGLHDRMNGIRPVLSKLVVQSQDERLYGASEVRTSTNHPVVSSTDDGWLVDLLAGERVLTPLQIRSGRVLFTSTNPTIIGGEVWANEFDYLTGGAPRLVIYDMNADGKLDTGDNADGNVDGDTLDPEDRVTGLYQGGGIVVSQPTLATVSASSGIFYINRINHSVAVPPEIVAPEILAGPGIAGGHFDVDTSSFIAPIDSGSTDGHVHEYDDKHDVKGVDYFAFFTGNLHEISVDITDAAQRFKIIVVNADGSSGGRVVINRTYDENNPGTYVPVTTYDDTPIAALPVYTLGGEPGTTQLSRFGMWFNRLAILTGGLQPTKTGCVKSNILASDGRWRNGALTTWAVAVNPDGTDAFTLTYDATDPTKIVGITSGLLWESTLFWHWRGPCAHEYTSLDDTYSVDDDTGEITTIWEFYRAVALEEAQREQQRTNKKEPKRDKDAPPLPPDDGGTAPPPPTDANNQVVEDTFSPEGNLSNPNRTSWGEHL
ncbi:MAG: PilC/PilY family type IV pilus protein [Proteobacteria bacterium]|nr:PilC/PilY family type IV pilus protein [Pseudomonadota bacterium]